MTSRTLIGAVAMAAALTTGAVVGATLGVPGTSGAQDDGTTTTTAPAGSGSGGSSDEAKPGAPGKGDGESGKAEGEGGRPGGRWGGPRRGPGFGFGAGLDEAAEALGISVEDLREELGDGKTLAEVATAHGVDRQELIDALVAAATERLDEAKAALPERIGELVERTFPKPGDGEHAPGRHGPRPDADHGDAGGSTTDEGGNSGNSGD